MNAAVVDSFDAPPQYTSFAEPVAGDGERLVSVTAAGLHPIVKALAKGTHYGSSRELPFVAGVDGVGRLEDGTRVFFGVARSPFGTLSERSVAANWMCLPLPEGVDDVTAAGIANPAMSSWVALTARAKFVAGESVLVLGATGVAGQLAVQIAKRLGARRVVAAGRNPQSLEKLKALGADAVISLDQDADIVSVCLPQRVCRSWSGRCARLCLGRPCGACARSDLAKRTAKGLGAGPIYSDRGRCGQDSPAACSGPSQFGARTPGQRLRKCITRSNPAGARGVLSGSGHAASSLPDRGRPLARDRGALELRGRRHAAGVSALASDRNGLPVKKC